MQRFVFIGTESFVGNVKMSRFGTKFMIEEKIALMAQKGGTPLLAEEDFEVIGFTERDLKYWSDPFMHEHDVPANKEEAQEKAEFLERKSLALAKYREIQNELLEEHNRMTIDVYFGAPKVDVVEVND